MYKWEKIAGKRGVRINKLALETGFNRSNLYNWSTGNISPSLDNVKLFTKAFNDFFGTNHTWFTLWSDAGE